MSTELTNILKQLKKAKCPEDVFGKADADAGKKLYRQFAKVCHADKYTDAKEKKTADEAFILLEKWWTQAESKFKDGTYGDKKIVDTSAPAAITIQSKTRVYVVGDMVGSGTLADTFASSYSDGTKTIDVLLKIARSPKDHDLMAAEKTALVALNKVKEAEFRVPKLVESFVVQDATGVKRAANVFEKFPDLVSLEHVMKAVNGPLDPKDVAWMANRIWACLATTHAAGYIHGAVVPSHVLISPPNHGAILSNWCYSVKENELIKAVVPKYKELAAPEIFAKKNVTRSADIFMAAATISLLLGGTLGSMPSSATFPVAVPPEMQRFLRGCMIQAPNRRPDSAWDLQDEWKAMLKKRFGPPKFRDFRVPTLVTA
jgi:serine/threonine protein kinase